MAEAVVSLAVQRITDLLIQEADYLSGVRQEVTRLQDELKRMQCFLKDADRMQDQDERVRNWVAEIRCVAYDAEDVIDTFILKAATGRGRGIKSCTSIFTRGRAFHAIRNQTEALRTKIVDISASMQTYGIQFVTEKEGSSSVNATKQRLRRSYPHEEEQLVIGFEQIEKDLKTQLMAEEERLRVVSVAGMGGLGKTTLAKKVYNDNQAKQHFDCYGWASISQQFSSKDILIRILMDVVSGEEKSELLRMEPSARIKEEISFKSMLEGIKEEAVLKSMLEGLSEEDLIKNLYKVLEGKRYLVVLDDIWSVEPWDCLKHAFPNGKKGSKILFTTRNREVASFADPMSSPVEPPFLTVDESWKLLSLKTFPTESMMEHGYPPEFEKLGKEMAEKCGGLPLAVVVLGGLLATKKSAQEWKVVQRNVNAQFTKLQQHHHYDGVYGILGMSYQDLPFHLKPCFLHLSQYPENWQFHKRSVIRLWMAEGFVPQPLQAEGEETMEDIGEQFLDELVSRCMVQVSEKDSLGIGVKTFRMHDLMRDMCISKARDENFAEAIEHRDNMATENSRCFLNSATSKSRRIAIQSRISRGNGGGKRLDAPLVNCGESNLRSLVYFVETDEYSMGRHTEMYVHKNFRLLRVLNLRGIKLRKGDLHRALGNLIHLRYLGLRNTGLGEDKLSSCLLATTLLIFLLVHRKCKNLTDEIREGELVAMIITFQKLECLFSCVLMGLPKSIGNLKNLYTLDVRDNGIVRLPNVVWRLGNLRHLLIGSISASFQLGNLQRLETLKAVWAGQLIRNGAVFKLPNLRNLAIYFAERKEAETVLKSPIFGLASRLRSLKMEMVTAGISFSNLESLSGCPCLTKLRLVGEISEDIQTVQHKLEFLPKSLVTLGLSGSKLKQDPMGILEKMPDLRCLLLGEDSYTGSKMACSVGGFPQLEFLGLGGINEVEEWEIEEGAMPCLKALHIRNPSKLRMLPQGLKFVTTIRELEFTGLKDELKSRVQVQNEVEGEDFHKIRHIPSISIIHLD